MEITLKDLKKLKLSPSLICLLKAIHSKDDTFIKNLDEVADVSLMGKHLQDKMIIKIVGDEKTWKSFEIRKLDIINYLSEDKNGNGAVAEAIFKYFIYTLDKHTGKKSRMQYKTYKKYLIGRVNQGVDLNNAQAIIDMKFEEWYGSEWERHLNFETLLGSKHYGQYLQQLDMKESRESKNKTFDINEMI